MPMATLTTYTCDRCATKVGPAEGPPVGWSTINGMGYGPVPEGQQGISMITAGALLCDTCTTALDAFMAPAKFKLSPTYPETPPA